MRTFTDLINRWPTIKDFAEEINVSHAAAQSMHRRASIRSTHWAKIIKAAQKRGFKNVTQKKMLKLQEASDEEKPRPAYEVLIGA